MPLQSWLSGRLSSRPSTLPHQVARSLFDGKIEQYTRCFFAALAPDRSPPLGFLDVRKPVARLSKLNLAIHAGPRCHRIHKPLHASVEKSFPIRLASPPAPA